MTPLLLVNQTLDRRHAMSDGEHGQSVDDAQKAANDFVRDMINKARNEKKRCDAMRDLGLAMHAVQDSTSPAHHGFQPWSDKEPRNQQLDHVEKENFDPMGGSQLDKATKDVYDYFSGAKPMPDNVFIYGADTQPPAPVQTQPSPKGITPSHPPGF
ncbi:MAG TPA: hypothetical protein VF988_05265 [Verrucomicrobiae bacterium]